MGEFTSPGDTKRSCDFIALSLDMNVFPPEPEAYVISNSLLCWVIICSLCLATFQGPVGGWAMLMGAAQYIRTTVSLTQGYVVNVC